MSLSFVICCFSFSILSFNRSVLASATAGLPDPPNHHRKITVNALLNLLHARLDLALSKVTVAVIYGFEFATVDGVHWKKKLRLRQSTTNCRQTLQMALPLSRRKSAIVLKSGANRPVSHINSILRFASRSSRRLD